MQVTLEITGKELTLLYLATGNEDAGRLVRDAAREAAKVEPKKVRKTRARIRKED